MSYEWQRARARPLDVRSRAQRGVQPLVSFGHSRMHRRAAADARALRCSEFRRFRARYPWVHDVRDVERGQPLRRADVQPRASSSPRYWRKLRQRVPALQDPRRRAARHAEHARAGSRRFRRHAARRAALRGACTTTSRPTASAPTACAALLRAHEGQVWLTEVGGIVKRRTEEALHGQAHPGVRGARRSASRASSSTSVVPLSPRITRVYLYHWNAATRRRHAGTRRSSARPAERAPGVRRAAATACARCAADARRCGSRSSPTRTCRAAARRLPDALRRGAARRRPDPPRRRHRDGRGARRARGASARRCARCSATSTSRRCVDAACPRTRVVEADGARIAMVHDAGPATGRLERLRARFPDADAVVFGHSHIPLHEERDGFQIFNPGSPTDRRRQPRAHDGRRRGRCRRATCAFRHLVVDPQHA